MSGINIVTPKGWLEVRMLIIRRLGLSQISLSPNGWWTAVENLMALFDHGSEANAMYYMVDEFITNPHNPTLAWEHALDQLMRQVMIHKLLGDE